jgi:hypothetical protein
VTTLTQVEGVEDAIAAAAAGAGRVFACLGTGNIGRAVLPLEVTQVTVVQDDDAPGSPARPALGRGIARILLQGRPVTVTLRAGLLSEGAKDIADLVVRDVELARRQLGEADSIKIMLEALEKENFLEEVSHASTDTYETTRKLIAEALGWRAGVLDEDRNKRRQARAQLANQVDIGGTDIIDPEPWSNAIANIGEVLDEAVAEIRRFLVVPDESYYYVIALSA